VDRDLSDLETAPLIQEGLPTLAIGGTEHGAHGLLQKPATGPHVAKQRLQRAPVKEANDASFNQNADRGRPTDKGQRRGDQKRIIEQARGKTVCGWFPVPRRVTYAPIMTISPWAMLITPHHSEGDGQANGREQQKPSRATGPYQAFLHGGTRIASLFWMV